MTLIGEFLIYCGQALRAMFRRPWQLREFVQQAWFISSVSIAPAALVSIPFGAVIALQLGSLVRQLGAQSFTGAASVLAVVREAGPIVTALIIAGDKDPDTPRSHGEEIVRLLPHADIVAIADGGHLALLEHPVPVTEALTELLSRVSRRDR